MAESDNSIYITICLVCVCFISISIGVFFMISNKSKEPLVPGFYGADFGENLMGNKETVDSCQNWAKSKGYPMYGHRNDAHGDPNWRNTCFGYTKTNVYAGNPGDTAHNVGCTDTSKSVLNGCA